MTENEDGLDYLRIPYEKIKFGKKLEVQGYGTVFQGEFNDRRVALKQLNITNLGNVKPKLLAEILTISRFRRHPNLVALLGFCDEKSNEIILVYEFVSSGNLADKMRKRLTTIQRLEICLGAARGLDYLHTGVDASTPGIIHGNIKLSKILLNLDSNLSKFEAKVSSFGLSKMLPGQAQKILESTDTGDEVTERVTKESDVYSFGVLLLEVLCGVPELVDTDDYQERHVTELVPKRLEQNKLRKIVHFDIRKEIKEESLETYAKIACQCVLKNPEERPSMAKVVEELEKALRLQGGQVFDVQIDGSRIVDGAPDGTVIVPPEDGSGVLVDSELDVVGEDDADEVNIVGAISESNNGEENAAEDVGMGREVSDVHILGSSNRNGLPEETINEDDQQEDDDGETMGSNIAQKTPEVKETIDDPSLSDRLDTERQNNGDDDRSIDTSSEHMNEEKNAVEDTITITTQGRSFHPPILDDIDEESTVPNRTSTEKESINDPETTEEIVDELKLKEKSKINGEREDHNRNKTDHSLTPYQNQDEVGDEFEYLRIPYKKIQFGKKIDIHGYGNMFQGEFDHQQVALKWLNITNLAHIKPKLLAEILLVARFRQHPNVVSLLGFCDEKTNELILVYEYVSSGNLADKMSKHLTTIQRLEICLGAARGLDYLHTGFDSTPGIVHADIKLSKILLNSHSSKFEAKVSSFGLSKLLPGQAQKTLEPTNKAADVYSFGVLLLEVLCGVRELIDTDDYQERHVTELVPKRLGQNILRTIVHFDIRKEITAESLESYAKIACLCVMEDPEERPTMAQVVKELEKALKLQGGEASDVHILGSSNGNADLPEETINENDTKEDDDDDDDGETMGSNIAEKNREVKETSDDLMLSDPLDSARENNDRNVAEDSITSQGSEDGESGSKSTTKDPQSTQEIIDDLKSRQELEIIPETEVDNRNKITTGSLESNNGDGTREDDAETKEEIADDKNRATEIAMEEKNSGILDSGSVNAGEENTNSALLNVQDTEKKPELIVNKREGDFSDFTTNDEFKPIQESESMLSHSISTHSESSNGDDTTPSDYLLQKSPAKSITVKKTSTNVSRNCCSWWRFFSDRVVLYGGQFWNKVVLCFTWMKGLFSNKRD